MNCISSPDPSFWDSSPVWLISLNLSRFSPLLNHSEVILPYSESLWLSVGCRSWSSHRRDADMWTWRCLLLQKQMKTRTSQAPLLGTTSARTQKERCPDTFLNTSFNPLCPYLQPTIEPVVPLYPGPGPRASPHDVIWPVRTSGPFSSPPVTSWSDDDGPSWSHEMLPQPQPCGPLSNLSST